MDFYGYSLKGLNIDNFICQFSSHVHVKEISAIKKLYDDEAI
jgi:hypothetical protein